MALPAWIVISVAMLLTYFCTQHDLAVQEDEDDRRRQEVLRAICIYTIAVTSFLSLAALLVAVHFDDILFELMDGAGALATVTSTVNMYTQKLENYRLSRDEL